MPSIGNHLQSTAQTLHGREHWLDGNQPGMIAHSLQSSWLTANPNRCDVKSNRRSPLQQHLLLINIQSCAFCNDQPSIRRMRQLIQINQHCFRRVQASQSAGKHSTVSGTGRWRHNGQLHVGNWPLQPHANHVQVGVSRSDQYQFAPGQPLHHCHFLRSAASALENEPWKTKQGKRALENETGNGPQSITVSASHRLRNAKSVNTHDSGQDRRADWQL